MTGTPRRGPGGFPATPQTNRNPGIRSPNAPTPSRPNVRVPLANVPQTAPQPTTGPLIPTSVLDAAQQRFYVFAVYLLLWAMRIYDFYNLAVDDQESVWQFLKWLMIDMIFMFAIPHLEIPWLDWSNLTSVLLFGLHAGIDMMLMFRIGVCITNSKILLILTSLDSCAVMGALAGGLHVGQRAGTRWEQCQAWSSPK
jgi:nucleoporin POM152